MLKYHRAAHYAISCILSLMALLGTSSSFAQASFGEKTARLSNFTQENGPIRMDGIAKSFDIYIPLASTAKISRSWLDLQFTHSIMLLGNRSSIQVLFNDTTLAQIPYTSEQPNARVKVLIPNELWNTGFNKLSLSVIQHYVDRCEDATSPELWTELNLHDSILAYTVEPVERELHLRELSGLFSPGIGGLNSILLLNSPKADLSNENSSYLNKSLPLIAQSLALRRDYSPLTVKHARWITNQAINHTSLAKGQTATAAYIPATHSPEGHVLIGTKAELATILPKTLVDKIKGPFLYLDRVNALTGADRLRPAREVRLIVSGLSGSDVILASRVLAQMNDAVIALQHLNLPDKNKQAAWPSTPGNYFLQPDTRYTFAELGRPTTTMHGVGTKSVTVKLPMRGNFYTHESASVELSLDFTYGAGMGAGSVMSVLLNGEYVQGLQLNKPNGMGFRNYRISLPARMLHPGTNTLEFEFSLRADTVAGECRSIPASHLLVQMLDSSSIRLPNASPVAIQPDLAAFSATAFPYIANTDTVPTVLVVGSETLLGDALTLAGKLAQLSHTTADQLVVRTTIPGKPAGNTILLATRREMPENIFVSVSETLDRSQHWSYRLLNLVKPVKADPSWDAKRLHVDNLTHNGSLDHLGVLMAMRNPHSPSPAALTIISADTHAVLTQRIADLLTPQVWGQLKGDLVLWEGPGEPVVAMQVGEHYELGEKDRWHMLILTLSINPWYMLAALLVTIFSISLLTRGYLRRREAQKLAE